MCNFTTDNEIQHCCLPVPLEIQTKLIESRLISPHLPALKTNIEVWYSKLNFKMYCVTNLPLCKSRLFSADIS